VSVTCMEPVGPERRDTNLHSRELLMASKLIYIRSCYIFHSNNAFRDLRIIDPSNMSAS
jgi:chromatin segregation and condensation protein Rec8/ScpA/Scc1 (kleisin family)